MTKTEKKSTKIDIAPLALRIMAVAAMIDAGMGQSYSQPIADGAYDLEHLQVVYRVAAGRQRGMDEVVATVAALGAWAHVYPVSDGLFWSLTGGTEPREPTPGIVIDPPTGIPFYTVGTAYTKTILDVAEAWAHDGAAHPTEVEGVFKHLRYVLAHRDHLHAQVGELQTVNTRLLLEAREAHATLEKDRLARCGSCGAVALAADLEACRVCGNGDETAEQTIATLRAQVADLKRAQATKGASP